MRTTYLLTGVRARALATLFALPGRVEPLVRAEARDTVSSSKGASPGAGFLALRRMDHGDCRLIAALTYASDGWRDRPATAGWAAWVVVVSADQVKPVLAEARAYVQKWLATNAEREVVWDGALPPLGQN